MNFQRILVPIVAIAAFAMAWRSYGWKGIAVVVTMLAFWVLLNFSRMMQVLKRAANRPIGHVDSAVMLNAKLKAGMTLMHVVAMTRSLGSLQTPKGAQPEVFTWTDAGASQVTCTFAGGKLALHELRRPAAGEGDGTPEGAALPASSTP
jgi:hypothetical protein